MLDALPNEVLEAILDHVPLKVHLLPLSMISRKFRVLLFPRLFQVLTIRASDELSLWDLEKHSRFDSDQMERVPEVFKAVKELKFCAPFELMEFEDDPDWIPTERGQHLESDTPLRLPLSAALLNNTFTAPSEGFDASTQWASCLLDPSYLLRIEEGDAGLIILVMRMLRMLLVLPDGQLTSFSWDMGTSLPKLIHGEDGYLATFQHRLQKLSLINDMDSMSALNFTNLRELSWKGNLEDTDSLTLRQFLAPYLEKLTSLQLDFTWNQDRNGMRAPLLDLMFHAHDDEHHNYLPDLKTLSLSSGSFYGSPFKLIEALNLARVNKIQLINCDNTAAFLREAVLYTHIFKASSVEFVVAAPPNFVQFREVDFLAPFSDLKDIFLMFESAYSDRKYFKTLLRHQNTLRRLVYHRRGICELPGAPFYDRYRDMAFGYESIDSFAELLRATKLECLGICGEPRKIKKVFERDICQLDSLKLLHLRFVGKAQPKPKFLLHKSPCHSTVYSRFEATEPTEIDAEKLAIRRYDRGLIDNDPTLEWEAVRRAAWRQAEETELENFADWVFGPHGLPRLQLLASGDFSHGNRFLYSQLLLCRTNPGPERTKSWRAVQPTDVAETELIDANRDMITACPVTPLYYYQGEGSIFPGIS